MVNEAKKSSPTEELSGPQYWRSLDELAETPGFQEFVEREFPSGAEELAGVNRRGFLKIMAASFAMAGLGFSGCRRPEQYIAPYSQGNDRVVPGNPNFYATAMPHPVDSTPLVVKTLQARPVKVEGNSAYAPYGGATDGFAQSSLLDMFDPDRSTSSVNVAGGNAALSRAQLIDTLAGMRDKALSDGGSRLAILAEGSTSLTRATLVAELQEQFPSLRFCAYEPAFADNAEKALEAITGRRLRPVYELSGAKRVLGVDADFTSSMPGSLKYARDFASSRRVHRAAEAYRMSRLYQVESRFTVTGTLADHRLRLDASRMTAFMALLVAELLERSAGDVVLAGELRGYVGEAGPEPAWVRECAIDLLSHREEAVVVAAPELPLVVHMLAYEANRILGARGHTVRYLEVPAEEKTDFADLVAALEAGEIEDLLILGGNPVYQTPGDVDMAKLIGRAERSVRLGYHFDETSLACSMHVHGRHYLESWDDARAYDGTLFGVQPMIQPLFNGWQANEFLAVLAGREDTEPYSLVYGTFLQREGGSLAEPEEKFNAWLHQGYAADSAYPEYARSPNGAAALQAAVSESPKAGAVATKESLEVRLLPDATMLDGRYANNGWLQESPDPMTKLTWDNAILVSPVLAKELGFDPRQNAWLPISARPINSLQGSKQKAPMAELTIGETTVRGPIHIQPGMPNYTVAVMLGYGRRKTGRVGEGAGFDAYPLMTTAHRVWREGATLTLTSETYALANTQDHWSMEGRAIVREANLDYYKKDPEWATHMGVESHAPDNYREHADASIKDKAAHQYRGNSLYSTPRFDSNLPNWPKDTEPGGPHQWGMAIDLNTCTGCNACVTACQSENNIPIVGKDQVMRGREMHWIRLDRYYATGDTTKNNGELPEDPQAVTMPMLCQHCENAPCEQVCPVNATVHDSQGLNTMAYNRCVGTRYCANNCPYKVRRYNFFDWNKRAIGEFYKGPLGENKYETENLPDLRRNPEVTVRMRGVMEKCTFCVQRIEDGKIRQKAKAGGSADVVVPDGVIRVACQQVCPTESIRFGNILDEESDVYHWKSSDRAYDVLGYLNVRPRISYLGRIRNPNPAMPDYFDQPLTRKEYKQKAGGSHDGESHDESHGADAPHESDPTEEPVSP